MGKPMKVETSFRKLTFGHYQMSAIGGMTAALAIISTTLHLTKIRVFTTSS